MSTHSATRSQAGLTKSEIRRFGSMLASRGKVLLKHPAIVRQLLRKPKRIDGALLSLVPAQDPHAETRKRWETLYLKYFGLTVDLSKVAVPASKEGFSRLVIVAPSVTLGSAMAACKKHFPTWQYHNDLDKDVTENPGTAIGGAYARWFRDRVEADEETADTSADQLKEAGTPGITLLERILMELDYFDRTGEHLDKENVTLCSGSRVSGGVVPDCCWGGGKFCVDWCYPGFSGSGLRSRVAVS